MRSFTGSRVGYEVSNKEWNSCDRCVIGPRMVTDELQKLHVKSSKVLGFGDRVSCKVW